MKFPNLAAGFLPAAPRAVSRVFAKERPAALPMPGNRTARSVPSADAMTKWAAEASGVRALAQGDNVVTMFGVIGEDYWAEDGGITAKKVAAQLRAIGDRPVEVQVNSPGGDMFEGIAIYNILREHSQPVTVKVLGMAASAASIIAMAGDTIEIGAASFLMIHNCWVVSIGNRHDMAKTSEWLEPFDAALASVYVQRTGLKQAEIAKLMDDESYFSGATAVEKGFADELLSGDRITVDAEARDKVRAEQPARLAVAAFEAQGFSRSQARAMVKSLKGTPSAADEPSAMPSAGDTKLSEALAGLLGTLQSLKPE